MADEAPVTNPNPESSTPAEDNPYTLGGESAVDVNPLMGVHEDLPDPDAPPTETLSEEVPEADEQKPTETPVEAPTETPEKVEVLGREFEVESLKKILENGESYQERLAALEASEQSNKELLEFGSTYAEALNALNSSPEGAKALIDAITNAAKEKHGDALKLDAALSSAKDELDDLDEDLMSDEAKAVSRSLNQKLAQRDRELASLRTENKAVHEKLSRVEKLLDKFEPVIESARFADEADGYVAQIKKEFGSDVTPNELRTMMRETGIQNPVQAFQVATYKAAQKAGYDRGYQSGAKTKPNMPVGDGRTFDISGMTADEIAERARKGQIPA